MNFWRLGRHKILFILAIGVALIPRVGAQATSLELPTEYLNNSTAGGLNTIPSNLEGTPYLTEDFQNGRIYVENNAPYAARLRYNAYQDEIQVQSGKGITSLYKRESLWAELGGETFKYYRYQTKSGISSGYFVELNTGPSRLLKRYEKVFREAQAASSSYSQDKSARFDEMVSYFLLRKQNPAQKVRLRTKDILEILGAEEAEAYVKKKKLKLRSEAAVIELLDHLNSKTGGE
jgi:hypothetical protein